MRITIDGQPFHHPSPETLTRLVLEDLEEQGADRPSVPNETGKSRTKITIRFEHNPYEDSAPFWARAGNERGELIACACANSFQEAEQRLMAKLTREAVPAPPDKEIEL